MEKFKHGKSRDRKIVNQNQERMKKKSYKLPLLCKLTKNIKDFRWRCSLDNAALGSHRLLNKIPSARHGIHPYELLVREAPEAIKTTQVTAMALGCPPGLDGKT